MEKSILGVALGIFLTYNFGVLHRIEKHLKGKCTLSFPDGSVVKNLHGKQETQECGFDPWFGQIP